MQTLHPEPPANVDYLAMRASLRGARGAESSLHDRRSSTMLRDHYLRELRHLRDHRTPGSEYSTV